MKVAQILEIVKARGMRIVLENGQPVLKHRNGDVTDELLTVLRSYREAIIRYLGGKPAPPAPLPKDERGVPEWLSIFSRTEMEMMWAAIPWDAQKGLPGVLVQAWRRTPTAVHLFEFVHWIKWAKEQEEDVQDGLFDKPC